MQERGGLRSVACGARGNNRPAASDMGLLIFLHITALARVATIIRRLHATTF